MWIDFLGLILVHINYILSQMFISNIHNQANINFVLQDGVSFQLSILSNLLKAESHLTKIKTWPKFNFRSPNR